MGHFLFGVANEGQIRLNLSPPVIQYFRSLPLFDFRLGNNPYHKQKLTKEQKKEKSDRLRTSLSHDKRLGKISSFPFNYEFHT